MTTKTQYRHAATDYQEFEDGPDEGGAEIEDYEKDVLMGMLPETLPEITPGGQDSEGEQRQTQRSIQWDALQSAVQSSLKSNVSRRSNSGLNFPGPPYLCPSAANASSTFTPAERQSSIREG